MAKGLTVCLNLRRVNPRQNDPTLHKRNWRIDPMGTAMESAYRETPLFKSSSGALSVSQFELPS